MRRDELQLNKIDFALSSSSSSASSGGSQRIGHPSVHIFWEDNWALVLFGIWRDIFFMMYEYKFGMVHIVSCVMHLGSRIFVFGIVDLVSSGLRGAGVGGSWEGESRK